MEENREKNNKKIEDEKRLEQDLRQMADDVILPDSLEPRQFRKCFRQDRKKSSRDQKQKRRKRTGNVSYRSQQRHVSV